MPMPYSRPQPHQRRTRLGRAVARLGATAAIATSVLLSLSAAPRSQVEPLASLSDAEFWELFTSMSEAGGSFVSENFVSNEVSFQEVIPTLQRSLTRGGVYLGVGPEQNFTYIANLKPVMAVIFDIRRQNAMQHLMYKALFEMSPTRADFIARLFSRPFVARAGTMSSVAELFDSATAAPANDSVYRANSEEIVRILTETHGFSLSPEDRATILNVYGVFFRAGPNINYGYRSNSPVVFQASYPTFGMLQQATNADSVAMAFLATEDNYRVVRALQLRNLVVPVVGDFAGRTAIRSIGAYLERRALTVTAFYLSNVEQYLFRDRGAPDRFYGNVAALPLDSTSTFIRSVPGGAQATMNFSPNIVVFRAGGAPVGAGGNVVSYSVTIDSAGVRRIRTVQDSAGVRVVREQVDSSGRRVARLADTTRSPGAANPDSARLASLRALMFARDSLVAFTTSRPATVATRSVMMGGLLTSGLVSIRETLDAMFAGRLTTYQDVIAMTKTSGWK